MTKLYTAQDVARFCEVDLKTVHHWAERGKVAHHRTEGRHLRFRRNDIVRFLRAHDYPMPDALTHAKPIVAMAPIDGVLPVELAKKLSSRFTTKRFASGLSAIASISTNPFDALVVASNDASFGPGSIAALKADPETAWLCIALIAPDEALRVPEADLVLPDVSRLAAELGKSLAVVRE